MLSISLSVGGAKPQPCSGEDSTPAYSGPPNPQLEALTHRRYSRARSRLVDRWLVYADAEGFTECDRGVAL